MNISAPDFIILFMLLITVFIYIIWARMSIGKSFISQILLSFFWELIKRISFWSQGI